jgi:hypothetical protein
MTETILQVVVIVFLIVNLSLNLWAIKKLNDFDKREKK